MEESVKKKIIIIINRMPIIMQLIFCASRSPVHGYDEFIIIPSPLVSFSIVLYDIFTHTSPTIRKHLLFKNEPHTNRSVIPSVDIV